MGTLTRLTMGIVLVGSLLAVNLSATWGANTTYSRVLRMDLLTEGSQYGVEFSKNLSHSSLMYSAPGFSQEYVYSKRKNLIFCADAHSAGSFLPIRNECAGGFDVCTLGASVGYGCAYQQIPTTNSGDYFHLGTATQHNFTEGVAIVRKMLINSQIQEDNFFEDDNVTMPGHPLNLLPIAPVLTLDVKQFEDDLIQMVNISSMLGAGRTKFTWGSDFTEFHCTSMECIRNYTVLVTCKDPYGKVPRTCENHGQMKVSFSEPGADGYQHVASINGNLDMFCSDDVCEPVPQLSVSITRTFSGFEPNAEPEQYNVAPPGDLYSNGNINEASGGKPTFCSNVDRS